MRLLRIALITLGLLFCYAMQGQTVIVTGSKIQNTAGTKLSGTITWHPVLSTGQPVSYVSPGGGATVTTPLAAPVTNGAFTLQLPDTSLTNPPDICFWATFSNKAGDTFGDGKGYHCVQPHATAESDTDWCQAGVCNFDNYVPPTDVSTEANHGPPDMMTMWNSIVTQWLSTPGNTVQQLTPTDGSSITANLNGAALSAITLKLTAPDGILTRTLNVTGLTAGARFVVLINPADTNTSASLAPFRTLTFGSGCAWSFGPGVAVVNNVLTIPSYVSSSYLVYFMYDGTTCMGLVTH